MSKVITFSRYFPPHHIHKGEATNFVEKFWSGLLKIDGLDAAEYLKSIGKSASEYERYNPKFHTIRAGLRFKVGDMFSPRIWQNVPYKSNQLQFAPDLTVKKTWAFEMRCEAVNGKLKQSCLVNGEPYDHIKIARNDGLNPRDFLSWFNRPFTGQIICWNNEIKYV